MKNNNFVSTLESFTIIDDPDMITIESIIYGALESDTTTTDLKIDLRRLAKAKAKIKIETKTYIDLTVMLGWFWHDPWQDLVFIET